MLSPMHPAREICGRVRHLRATLIAQRIFGKVRFADLSEKEGEKDGVPCEDIERKLLELEALVAAVASDGKFTSDEHDNIAWVLRNTGSEDSGGRIV